MLFPFTGVDFSTPSAFFVERHTSDTNVTSANNSQRNYESLFSWRMRNSWVKLFDKSVGGFERQFCCWLPGRVTVTEQILQRLATCLDETGSIWDSSRCGWSHNSRRSLKILIKDLKKFPYIVQTTITWRPPIACTLVKPS